VAFGQRALLWPLFEKSDFFFRKKGKFLNPFFGGGVYL
jgi:hypothetical protein